MLDYNWISNINRSDDNNIIVRCKPCGGTFIIAPSSNEIKSGDVVPATSAVWEVRGAMIRSVAPFFRRSNHTYYRRSFRQSLSSTTAVNPPPPPPATTTATTNTTTTTSTSSSTSSSSWNWLRRFAGFYGEESTAIRHSHSLFNSCYDIGTQKHILKHLALEQDFFHNHAMINLHVWMVHNRLRTVGSQGKVMQEQIFDRFWEDTTKRTCHLIWKCSMFVCIQCSLFVFYFILIDFCYRYTCIGCTRAYCEQTFKGDTNLFIWCSDGIRSWFKR